MSVRVTVLVVEVRVPADASAENVYVIVRPASAPLAMPVTRFTALPAGMVVDPDESPLLLPSEACNVKPSGREASSDAVIRLSVVELWVMLYVVLASETDVNASVPMGPSVIVSAPGFPETEIFATALTETVTDCVAKFWDSPVSDPRAKRARTATRRAVERTETSMAWIMDDGFDGFAAHPSFTPCAIGFWA